MALARYWRFSESTSGQRSVAEMELRTAAGASNEVLSGGTASASSVASGAPTQAADQAFDANTATEWISFGGGGVQWIQWDFGVGVQKDIRHLTLKNSAVYVPQNFTAGTLASSDDGVNWLPRIYVTGKTQDSGDVSVWLPPPFATADLSMPKGSLTAYSGGSARLNPSVSLGMVGFGGGTAALTGPMPTLSITGQDRTGDNAFVGALGMPGLVAYGGANGGLSMPSATLSAAGKVAITGNASLVLPAPSLVAVGTIAASATAAVGLSDPFLLVGYSGAVCSVQLSGGLTTQATGITGATGSAAITLPLFELTASGTQQTRGQANLLMPAARLGATAQAWLVMPGARLTAIGTATVAVTYEAYALNLKHALPDAADELTHFTNYPFDKIIRYQNSYFGVNSTGLYLLEGTTDDTAPIPYSVKTKLTDFGTDQKKTPEAAVFGGRLGPDATVTVYTGETEDDVYAYSTPRGQDVQNYRQKFGKGLKARYYAFGIQGDGAMALDTVSFDIAKLKRRI